MLPDSSSATAIRKVGATEAGVWQEAVREHAKHLSDRCCESCPGQLLSDIQYNQCKRPRLITGKEVVTTAAQPNMMCNCELIDDCCCCHLHDTVSRRLFPMRWCRMIHILLPPARLSGLKTCLFSFLRCCRLNSAK